MANSTADLSGQVIKGYELLRRVGGGRFGAVYYASQAHVYRDVAVKIIESDVANHPEFVRTFEAEAQVIARLEHIHIVPLYDYWREPNRAFLVMRWLRGGSLRDSLIAQGPWTIDKVARMLEQVAAALALAHRRGIIHRDIKPDNILLDEDHNALLGDFGIATTLAESKRAAEGGFLAGTPAYMAPELFMGEPASVQSDIYALGVLLFEVLTLTRPFPDDTTDIIRRHHISTPVPALRVNNVDLPHELNLVIWRAMAKTRTARFSSVTELANAFQAAVLPNLPPTTPTDETPHLTAMSSPATAIISGPSQVAPDTLIVESPLRLENPYKGLRPFEQADAADFFGREVLVKQLLDRMAHAESRFIALVGPSGSGKSSIVKAGLIPALRMGDLAGAQDWYTVEMVPGDDPFRELEAALQRVSIQRVPDMRAQLTADEQGITAVVNQILPADAPTQLLLFIDQFEEVFTQVEAEEVRQQFLANLSAAVNAAGSRLFVVITLRADFYDRPLHYGGIGALMRSSSEVILPLNPQELKLAIENPAGRLGLTVEPELITAIVADINQQPGALPLLQYALTELFEHRQGNVLSLIAYQAIGGITAALARRAEAVYGALSADEQALARQLFLRLVRIDEETEITRRRLSWAAFRTLSDDHDLIEHVRDEFVKARLLTVDRDPKTREPTVEVAHEALLREWGQLVEWMNANREDILMQRRLNAIASEWQNARRDDGYLLTKTRLMRFEEWASSASLQLTQDEREFLDASIAERQAQLELELARLERERVLEIRTRNRLRLLVLVFAAAALLGFVLAEFALNQRSVAEDRLHDLEILSTTDRINLALADDNPELALALVSQLPQDLDGLPIQTRQTLYRAAYTPSARLVLDEPQDAVTSVAYSPDGQLAAAGAGRLSPITPKIDNALYVWNPNTGELIYHLTEADGGHTDSVTQVAFSPDGKLLASGSMDKTIIIWDVATGTALKRLEGHKDLVARVAFTPDGQRLVSTSGNFLFTVLPGMADFSSLDPSVRLWDVETGAEIFTFSGEDGGHTAPVMSVAISPDGARVVTGDSSGSIIVWDMATGQELSRMASPGDWVSSLAFLPDGNRFLAGLGRPSVGGIGATSTLMAMFDIETGQRVRNFAGHTNVVVSVAISPDGKTALTGSADQSLRLWDVESGNELRRFVGHDDWVFGVAISPDGSRALSGAVDGSVRVWDIESGNLVKVFPPGELARRRSIDLSTDATIAFAGHEDGLITRWDVATGTVTLQMETAAEVMAVVLSPDDARVATGDASGYLTLWDAATGEQLWQVDAHANYIMDMAYSPDGALIATGAGNPEDAAAGSDTSVAVWDAVTGQEVQRFEGHPDTVWGIAFSPDSQRIVSSSGPLIDTGSHRIAVWEVATGKELLSLEGHTDLIGSVDYSTDGAFILSSSDDTTVRLWDAKTGREIRRFEGHNEFINRALLIPTADLIVTGSGDDTIRLWEQATGNELYRTTAHRDTVRDIVLDTTGRWMLSLDNNGDMRLWRIDRSMVELMAWVEANRYVPALCVEQGMYRICQTDDATEDAGGG